MTEPRRTTKIIMILLVCLITTLSLPSIYADDTQPISTKTRKELLISYIKSLKVEDGFLNTSNSQLMDIESTYYGVILSDFLQITYDTYDIIYAIQSLQRSDYGFANDVQSNTSLISTYYAVKTLLRLGLSTDALQRWKIFDFANNSISSILYNSSKYASLNTKDMNLISKFLELTYLLNITIDFPYNALITALQSMQYTNGTYQSFTTAVECIKLLLLLNQKPHDVTGAINFLKAFRFNNTAFAKDGTANITITATYDAIYVLQGLGTTIEAKQRIVDTILDLQQMDGGFKEGKNDHQTTIKSTYYAYLILLSLDELGQLEQLAFLASTGYLDGFKLETAVILLLSSILILSLKRKRN